MTDIEGDGLQYGRKIGKRISKYSLPGPSLQDGLGLGSLLTMRHGANLGKITKTICGTQCTK